MTASTAADEASMGRTVSRYTGQVVAEKAGVPFEVADRLWRALGHPDVHSDERIFTDDDVHALRLVTDGWAMSDPDARDNAMDLVLQTVRSLSALLTSVAEAQLDFIAGVQRAGLGPRLRDSRDQRGIGSSELGWLLGYVLRSREETSDAVRTPPDDAEQLAVGFTDLVGYTELSSRVDDGALTDTIAQFQSVAFDAIAESGSRAVKLVGDAVMYVSPRACQDFCVSSCARAG